MYPVLHVDTVGETLADILLRGRGETLYMPGMMRYLHLLVSLPESYHAPLVRVSWKC